MIPKDRQMIMLHDWGEYKVSEVIFDDRFYFSKDGLFLFIPVEAIDRILKFRGNFDENCIRQIKKHIENQFNLKIEMNNIVDMAVKDINDNPPLEGITAYRVDGHEIYYDHESTIVVSGFPGLDDVLEIDINRSLDRWLLKEPALIAATFKELCEKLLRYQIKETEDRLYLLKESLKKVTK